MILPRQGKVVPKATEWEDTKQRLSLSSPTVWQEPATSPWRGRIVNTYAAAFAFRRQNGRALPDCSTPLRNSRAPTVMKIVTHSACHASAAT
jgi:hypothetical protein